MGLRLTTPVDKSIDSLQLKFNIRGFGINTHGECGVDGYPFGKEHNVIALASGAHHNLALLLDGTMSAWGGNLFGQLGNYRVAADKLHDSNPYPVRIYLPKPHYGFKVASIAAGVWHSACVTESGLLFTWGLGHDGQLGYICDPASSLLSPLSYRFQSSPRLVEAFAKTPVDSVALGEKFTVVLTRSGNVFTFGAGRNGVLGTNSQANAYEPEMISELEQIEKVCTGWSHTLALAKAGLVYMWGNPYSDINEFIPPIKSPTLVTGIGLRVVEIAAGDYHSLVLAIDSSLERVVYSWGGNGYGQLGYDTSLEDDRYLMMTPQRVRGLSNVMQIQCGGCSSFALTADRTVYAWGFNNHGQFGPGITGTVPAPQVIYESRNERIEGLSSGHSHIFLMTIDAQQIREDTNKTQLVSVSKTQRVLLKKTDEQPEILLRP